MLNARDRFGVVTSLKDRGYRIQPPGRAALDRLPVRRSVAYQAVGIRAAGHPYHAPLDGFPQTFPERACG